MNDRGTSAWVGDFGALILATTDVPVSGLPVHCTLGLADVSAAPEPHGSWPGALATLLASPGCAQNPNPPGLAPWREHEKTGRWQAAVS